MSLELLQKYDAVTASAILAEAALYSGPHLDDGEFSPWQSEIELLLGELRTKLGLSKDDVTSNAQQKIDDALSSELDSVAFSDTDFDAVKVTLANKGELPTSAYKVTLNTLFSRRFREKEDFLKRSLLTADTVQHLSVDVPEASLDEQGRLSIYMKKVGSSARPHWLLINTNRSAKVLQIVSAWRAFPDILDLKGAKLPMDVLRVFAKHYGMNIEIPGVVISTFLENFPLDQWMESQNRKIHDDGRMAFFQESAYRTSSNGMMLAYTYAIDEQRYKADLTRHGV